MKSVENAGSGIEGEVVLGPISPVEMAGVSNDRPYQTSISVVDEAGRTVMVFQSNARGRFQVELAPGRYVLRPHSPISSPSAPAQPISVEKSRYTSVRICYDSGIR